MFATLSRRRAARRPWARWLGLLALAYGVGASLVVLGIVVLRDGSASSYTAALLSFWWSLPAPVMLVVALVTRSWAAVVTLVVPVLLAGWLQAPWLLNAVTGTDDAPADLRVATFNISADTPIDGVVQLAEDSAPDVLLLQEVTPEARAELEDRLPQYRFTSFSPVIDAADDKDNGSAVLSVFPITDTEPVTGLPPGARPSDQVTVDVEGRSVAVISVHLASPCIGCIGRYAALNQAGDTKEAAQVRIAEAERYAQLARELEAAGTPVVLAGDLNSSPLNQPLGVLTGAGLTDVHRAVGTRPGLTRGGTTFGLARVDVVLVSGLRPLRDSEGEPGASTHSPVIADLAWPTSR